MKFTEMLRARWRNADTLLCVGLDPDLARLPEELAGKPDAIYSFCTGIVDATADLVCAFKPQIAYFASEGAEDALNRVVAYIHSNHPGIPVILDAKRGDIGSTAKHYAEEAFDRYGADCVTLSPYMGGDTLDPYLAYAEKGAFVLCRTSNKGGDDLQMIDLGGGERLFERVGGATQQGGVGKRHDHDRQALQKAGGGGGSKAGAQAHAGELGCHDGADDGGANHKVAIDAESALMEEQQAGHKGDDAAQRNDARGVHAVHADLHEGVRKAPCDGNGK